MLNRIPINKDTSYAITPCSIFKIDVYVYKDYSNCRIAQNGVDLCDW